MTELIDGTVSEIPSPTKDNTVNGDHSVSDGNQKNTIDGIVNEDKNYINDLKGQSISDENVFEPCISPSNLLSTTSTTGERKNKARLLDLNESQEFINNTINEVVKEHMDVSSSNARLTLINDGELEISNTDYLTQESSMQNTDSNGTGIQDNVKNSDQLQTLNNVSKLEIRTSETVESTELNVNPSSTNDANSSVSSQFSSLNSGRIQTDSCTDNKFSDGDDKLASIQKQETVKAKPKFISKDSFESCIVLPNIVSSFQESNNSETNCSETVNTEPKSLEPRNFVCIDTNANNPVENERKESERIDDNVDKTAAACGESTVNNIKTFSDNSLLNHVQSNLNENTNIENHASGSKKTISPTRESVALSDTISACGNDSLEHEQSVKEVDSCQESRYSPLITTDNVGGKEVSLGQDRVSIESSTEIPNGPATQVNNVKKEGESNDSESNFLPLTEREVDKSDEKDHDVETEQKPETSSEKKHDDVETGQTFDTPSAEQQSGDEIMTTKEKEWMDILGNGKLKKKVLREGKGQESRPTMGDIVNIRYKGTLDNGTIVDKNSHLQIVLGDLDVIQAIDMTVALMENEEICTMYTDARYAYSIFGRPDLKPPIPQNANLTYEIEILSIQKFVPVEEMPTSDRLLHGDKKRSRGNDLYAKNDFAGAIDVYKRGLKYLEGSSEKEVIAMKLKCLNNLSAAQLKVKAYLMAFNSLNVVLELEPKNVKALFRKGKCLEGLGEDEQALESMKKASLLDPSNKQVTQELGRLRSRVAVAHQKEKEIYRRMFQQRKKSTDDSEGGDGSDNSLFYAVASSLVAVVAIGAGLLWYKYKL